MRPHRLGTSLGILAMTVALTSCSSDADESETLELDPTPSASPTPSAEPVESPSGEPTEDAIPTSYPEVGLEFDSLPEASGPRAAALTAYVAYERGLRQLSRTGELNPLLADNTGPALMSEMQSTATYLQGNDIRYEGTATLTVDFESFGDSAAILDLCTDSTELTLVTAGTPGPVQGAPRAVGRAVLTAQDGRWSVTQYDTLEKTC